MVICGTMQQRHAIAILPSRAQTMLATSDLDDFILITMWGGGGGGHGLLQTDTSKLGNTGTSSGGPIRHSYTMWLQVAH